MAFDDELQFEAALISLLTTKIRLGAGGAAL